MKLIVLLYLEDDEKCVARLLEDHGVLSHSRLNLEGFGKGMAGWYGDTAPFRSRMAFSLVPDDRSTELLAAVSACSSVGGARHPIHAIQLGVEAVADSAGGAASV